MDKTKTTKIPESMESQNHREYKKQTRKPRFQNQWVAKTIENTKKHQKTKISEPMGSQNHREYQHKLRTPRFQNQWVTKTIENTKNNKNKQDFRINGSGSRSLVLKSCFFVCFCILDGFRYPLVLKSWFSRFLLVFSMVWATHWF